MQSSTTTVIVGVTGSIAAYKAADIVSQLKKHGCNVHVIMSENAQHFITPLTLATLSGHPVVTSLWDEDKSLGPTHIELADQADLVLLAPATANLLAQMAYGLAGDVLTSMLLATRAPIIAAPAMNGKMYLHPATQENVKTLQSRGVEFIGPDKGMLACGYEGIGRLMPVDAIVAAVEKKLKQIASAKKT